MVELDGFDPYFCRTGGLVGKRRPSCRPNEFADVYNRFFLAESEQKREGQINVNFHMASFLVCCCLG